MFIGRKYFLLLTINILILLALSYKMDFFATINKSIYNNSISLLPHSNDAYKNITLVNAAESSTSDLHKLIDIISSYHPKMLYADIFHKSDKFDEKKLQKALDENEKTILMLPALKSEVNKQSANYLKHSGFFEKNIHKLSFYSLQTLYTHTSYKDMPSDKNLAPLLYINEGHLLEREKGYVSYNGNPSFVKISVTDILEENIIPSFFENKIVLISNFDNTYAVSPLSTLFGTEFLHQKHMALMINSALYDTWLYEFTIQQYFLFLTVFIALWVLLVYRLKNSYTLLLFIVSVLFPLSAYWLCVSYFNFLLPLSEMVVITIMVDFLLFKHWQNLKYKDESNLLLNIAKRLQDKVVHKTFFNSDAYWEDLNTLINQLFNLNKNILFEKVEGDTRIKEIVSFNCSFLDILEMRRDYTREPYTSAINNKKVTVSNRKFFHEIKENEKEFIVPLTYNNKVIGFWAFSLDSEEIEEVANFETIIANCANEISELVYQRNQFIAQQNKKEKKLERMLNVEIIDENTSNLKRSLAIIEKRMLLTETIFDNIHSRVIIYNLFGKIVQLNQGMNTLLQEEGIASYTLTAGDMLATLTELSVTEAKELIRDVTFTQKKHIQFVNLKNNKKRHLLTISSITKDEIADKFSENYIFDTFGVLFELVDISFIEKNHTFKEQVIEKSQLSQRDRLNVLQELVKSIEMDENASTKNVYTNNRLQSIVNDVLSSEDKLKGLIEQDLNTYDELYPIDIVKSINDVTSILTSQYEEKQIKFDLKYDTDLPFVLVAINSVEKHLYNLLTFLVNDSEENGTIGIYIEEKAEFIEVHMRSNGYGIPQEQFFSYLQSQSAPSSYAMLIQASKDFDSWSAKSSYSTQLGEGIVFDLSFLKVDL